ncbi:asparagine synthetase B family protein [Fulvivirga lutea]|uniref:Asparagine synthetase domain-containing protein n=1 Tax=Fulvivirga lutea TaxID=2810512 RepID=A0A975A024_9BACT|nr:hypothetical protein [Fulvivirga lutea]QSE96801.1 hypothetical protein JR347_14540 [Fulvivirga lutea]
MGAFLVAKRGYKDLRIDKVKFLFQRFGMKNFDCLEFKDHIVLVWDKELSKDKHQINIDGHHLIVAGTPIYKGCSTLSESLHAILNDLRSNSWDYRNVRGSFAFLYSPDGSYLSLYMDQAGIFNVYFDLHHNVISTSFLATIFGLSENVELNRNALIEVLTTGRLIGPDTLVDNVNRVELHIHDQIGNINITKDKTLLSIGHENFKNLSEALEYEIESVDRFFKDTKSFANNQGVDTGISSGHDSRMILIYLLRNLKKQKIQLHTYWRKTKDTELDIAEKVAKAAELDLKCIPIKHHFEKSNEEMASNLEEALLYYDGHVRMHCYFTEEYNTREHRLKILDDKRLGMNGVGGEQYRNEWHMESNKWSLTYFIRYYLCYHLAGRCFTNKSEEENYFNYLEKKIRTRLDIEKGRNYITRLEMSQYCNEVYVPSLMGARTNAENKISHFVTPFVDRQLIQDSYKAIPYHGLSYFFQQSIIRKLNKKLADVISGYGYSFSSGEPFVEKLKYIIKEITPKNIYQNRLDKKFTSKGNEDFMKFMNEFLIIREGVELLRAYKLPIDEFKLTSRPDLMPVYISLSYLILYLKKVNKLV